MGAKTRVNDSFLATITADPSDASPLPKLLQATVRCSPGARSRSRTPSQPATRDRGTACRNLAEPWAPTAAKQPDGAEAPHRPDEHSTSAPARPTQLYPHRAP